MLRRSSTQCFIRRRARESTRDSCKASLYKLLDCKVIDARDLRDLVDRNLQSLIEDTIEVDSSTLRVGSNYLAALEAEERELEMLAAEMGG